MPKTPEADQPRPPVLTLMYHVSSRESLSLMITSAEALNVEYQIRRTTSAFADSPIWEFIVYVYERDDVIRI